MAIPGQRTTAALLLQLYCPDLQAPVVTPFDRTMTAVAGGLVDAGVIIHEGRFTYSQYGLEQVVDLGNGGRGPRVIPSPWEALT
ncbi:MqnA/MqnD/SBP family protein [Candidatus Latescibacterota bacterium]